MIERIIKKVLPMLNEPNTNRLGKAIEQYIYKYTKKALDCQQKDHEQFVTKARIEVFEKFDGRKNLLEKGVNWSVTNEIVKQIALDSIAELKKGLE